MARTQDTQEAAKKFTGTIKLPGLTPFDFDTKAKTPAQAKNNGLMQYAKKLNMSIGTLHRHLKTTTPTITAVVVNDEEH